MLRLVIWTLLSFCFIACQQQPASDYATIRGYVTSKASRWPDPKNITVCWQRLDSDGNAASVYASEKDLIKAAVISEYSKIGFHFKNWKDCGINPSQVSLLFNPGLNKSFTYGIGADKTRETLVVEFGFLRPECGAPSYRDSNCLANDAIHEFGHVLGLHHEANRRDQEGCDEYDQTLGQGENVAVQIGDFNSESIMSYCRLLPANRDDVRIGLSLGDISAITMFQYSAYATIKDYKSTPVNRSTVWQVAGPDVLSYKYKVIEQAGMERCSDVTDYSSPIPIATPIRGSSILESNPGVFKLRVCILALDTHGNVQSLLSSSSYDFNVEVVIAPGSSPPVDLISG